MVVVVEVEAQLGRSGWPCRIKCIESTFVWIVEWLRILYALG